MEHWSSEADTAKKLCELGFVELEGCPGQFRASHPIQNKVTGEMESGLTVSIYHCNSGYHCVRILGHTGWMAPVVWNGPRAHWDKTDPGEEFVSYLDEHYPGWR